MINLGNGKYRSLEQINRSLRLEELLKERIENPGEHDYDLSTGYILQSLLEDSENA